MFFHILGRIIPTDFHVSQGLKPPTRFVISTINHRFFATAISRLNAIAHEDLAKDPEAQGQGQALHLAGGVGVDTINTEIQYNVNIYIYK